MDKEKLISICIPIYNGEEYIEETLVSVINQTYKNIEIIISDNCSTDNSVKIIEKWIKKDSRIRVNKNQENLGYSGNLNKLIKMANSEYIAIYHADDVYESTIIEEQVKFLDENQELAGCFTSGLIIDGNGEKIKKKFPFSKKNTDQKIIITLEKYLDAIFEYGNSILICPTSMIKKSVYQKMNGYDMDLRYIEDQDMWIRILEKYDLGIINKELIKYRIHSKQGSSYYRNLKISEISVHIKHIENYIKKNMNLEKKYKLKLNKIIAMGYLKLLKGNILRNEMKNLEKNIHISREKYIFSIFSKYGLIQRTDNRLIRIFFRILLEKNII